jgi:hypothetical protein
MTAGARSFQRSPQVVIHPTLGTRRRVERLPGSAELHYTERRRPARPVVGVTAGAAVKTTRSRTGHHIGTVVSGVVMPPRAGVPGSGTGLRRREGQAAVS